MSDRTARTRVYIVAFVITAAVFTTAFLASAYFTSWRTEDIRSAQDDISTDILSIETQFDLFTERSCRDIGENTILPTELSSLAGRLSYLESQGSGKSPEVIRLKRLYSLLEIKDYLLMKQVAAKCNLKPVFMFYFYSNSGDCPDCEKQGYVLTALTQKYPQLRIYSFDYHLDVPALQTLISIDNIQPQLPALFVNGHAIYGLQKVSDIEKILPQLANLNATSSAATSTKRK